MRTLLDTLERPRLLEMIDRENAVKIISLAAPAGYGKMTLARQWASRSGLNVAVVRLQEVHSGSSAFERDVLEALLPFAPEIDPSVNTVVSTTRQIKRGICLILDDYQSFVNEDIHRLVVTLSEHISSDSRIFLLSRTNVSGELSRLRRNGRILEIGASDLAFTDAESRELFGTSEKVHQVHTAGEGWIAGIKLAITADRTAVQDMSLIGASSSQISRHFLDEYVYEEILSRLPTDVRMFVMRTSDLPEISLALCNATFGEQDHASLMHVAIENGLDIRWHADKRGVFTYNPLFAESCQRLYQTFRPDPARRSSDLNRAMKWYQSRGELDLAIETAIRAEIWPAVTDLMRLAAESFYFQGQFHQITQWFDRISLTEILGDMEMAFWYFNAMVLNYEIDKAKLFVRQLDYVWHGRDESELRGRLAFCHSVVAIVAEEFDRAIELSQEALRLLPQDAYGERFLGHYSLFTVLLRLGSRPEAEEHAAHAVALRRYLPPHDRFWTYTFVADWADHLATCGELSEAFDHYRSALDGAPDYLGFGYCWLLNGIVSIADEQDNLETADIYLKRASVMLDPMTPVFRRLDLVRTSAQHARAKGLYSEAMAFAENYVHLTAEKNHVIGKHRGMALLALLWAETGDIERARQWATEEEGFVSRWPSMFGQMHGESVRAEIFFRAGQDDRALTMTQRLIAEAGRLSRVGDLVRLRTLESLILERRGNDVESRASLRAALQLGQPGGFIRSFFIPGFSITPILTTIEHDDPLAPYAQLLATKLSAASNVNATIDPSTVLSSRELDILDLLAQGLTNPEIADKLFISANTVRNHVSSLFRKLGVTSRTEAVNLTYHFRAVRPRQDEA